MMINKRLIGMVEGLQKYIGANILCQWLSMLANAAMVFCIGYLLQQALRSGASAGRVAGAACILAAAALIRYVCAVQAARMSYLSSRQAKSILREKIYKKMLALGASYTRHVGTAEVIQVAGEGVEQLENYFGKYLPQLFYSLLAPITLFIIISFVNLPAAAVLLVCVPLIPLSMFIISKRAKRVFARYWGVYTDLGANFLENLQGLTTLKIYRADGEKQREMSRKAEDFRRITMKVLRVQLGSVTVMDLVAYGGAAAGMIAAILQYRAGALGFMGCFSIILLSAEVFIPLRMLGSYFHVAMNGMAACDKMFALLDMPEGERKTKEIDASEIDIRIERLSFAYGEGGDGLKDVSLRLPRGQLVSLVGASGSGKSTLAALLTGSLADYRGSVSVGGAELSEISERSLMQNITLVGADSHIFKGSVRENLLMANLCAGEEEMWTALERVKLDGFLRSEKGLATPIQENAANLSGGQRQRLALARALLHDSPAYIFDEATSNIDAESEALIMDAVKQLAKEKAVLLISHRLANVVDSDCIYVLKNGKIAESGRHSALLDRKGVYARLYGKQKELEEFIPERKAVGCYA